MLDIIVKELLKYGIISLHILAVALLVYHIWKRKAPRFLKDNALLLSFILSFTAMAGSLFYSDYLGWVPCTLCWYQRIAMYPLALIYLIAYLKKDDKVLQYSLPLAIAGALIAGYHYLTQILESSSSCSLDGASCTATYVFYFGYMTIPLMALTVFLFIIYLGYARRS